MSKKQEELLRSVLDAWDAYEDARSAALSPFIERIRHYLNHQTDVVRYKLVIHVDGKVTFEARTSAAMVHQVLNRHYCVTNGLQWPTLETIIAMRAGDTITGKGSKTTYKLECLMNLTDYAPED